MSLDNVELDNLQAGDDVATDLISTDHYQLVKLTYGALGTANVVTSTATNPFPVALSDVDNAVLDVIAADTTSIDGKITACNTGAVVISSGSVTADLGANNDVTVQGEDAENAAASAAPVQVGGRYDATPRTLGDGDVGGIALDADGAVHISDGGNTITVDGTVDLGATDNAVLDSIAAGYAAEGAALGSGILLQGDDGTDRTNVLVDTDGHLQVDVLSVTDGGTYTEDTAHTTGDSGVFTLGVRNDTLAALAGTDGDYAPFQVNASGALYIQEGAAMDVSAATVTVDLGANNDVIASGDVAHDTADSGNPVKVGAKATNSIEGLTQVANDDRTDIRADLNGVLLTRPHTTLEENISERISNTNGTSTNFTNFAAGGAGVHNYVCDVTITNTSATDGYVDLRDGSAGSVIWTFPAPANSGATHSFSLPLKGAANTALAYDVSAALTTVYIAVNGFQAQG